MAEIINMPKLGFDMAEGTLMRWIKSEGDEVKKGEVLAEIETDKATVEVESSFAGVVHRLLIEQGAVVPVGTPIAVIAAPGEEVKEDFAAAGEEKPAPQAEAQATPAEAPPAAAEKPEEPKASTAPEASRPPEASEASKAPETPKAPEESEEGGMLKASPLAKKIAREKQLDLSGIQGSGPGGRIVRKDVEGALSRPVAPASAIAPAPASAPSPSAPPLPAPAAGAAPAPAADRRLPLDKLRAAIGRRMVEAKQQLPHFYVTHEYDMEALMALRKQVNSLLPEEEKISVNDFIVKAVALGLRQFRNINTSLAEGEIVQHGAVNIGVAVAVEGGLLTVVVRDADLKPLRLISAEVKEMAARARQGKVRPGDIEGSTFSISNLGMFDVEHFVAIINPPEAAILAVGSVRQVPVVLDGEIRPRQRMKATLSADHRVTDGAEAAQFLQALKQYLEEPVLLLL